MSGMRLALITQRFWPFVGGSEKMMSHLAVAFQNAGCRPSIVTAQWDRRWPRKMMHRDIPVTRLSHPSSPRWGAVRYMLVLGRWLRARRNEFDLVYVSGLRDDAYASLAAFGRATIPVVLRAEGAAKTGDLHWHRQATFGERIRRRCWSADALIAPSEAIAKEWHDAGCLRERLHRIPDGASVAPAPTSERRTAARKSLAACRPAFALKEDVFMAVFSGQLHFSKGLGDLVDAWGAIIARWPNARLWLVGDGPHREELKEYIALQRLEHRILLTGAFDDIEEVYQAADLFVLPSHAEGMSLALLEAMAAGLPVVATNIPGNREVVVDRECGILTPPHDAAALAEAMTGLIVHPKLRRELSQAARLRVAAHFSLADSVTRHLELFGNLIRNKQSSQRIQTTRNAELP